MKKFLLFLFIFFISEINVYGFEDIFVDERPPQTDQLVSPKEQNNIPEVIFDWADISKEQRIENVNKYKDIVFSDESNIYLSKDKFKSTFAQYKKDKEYKHHYMLTNNGVSEDEDAKYSPFYYRKNTLIIYAIQYKNNFHNSFYYTAFGKLFYVDITSQNYPNFPFYSMQYDKNGNFKSAIYFVSPDIRCLILTGNKFQPEKAGNLC